MHAESNPARPRITSDIFGRKSGYVHPYLSLSGMYTDNLLNAFEDKKEDFGAFVMPGIWVALPGLKTGLDPVSTSTATPGGMVFEQFDYQSFRRFLLYFNGSYQAETYAEYTDENTESNIFEARLRYQMKSGMAFEINGQRYRSHDKRGTGFSTMLEKYTTNYLLSTVTFCPTGRLSVSADYGIFQVDYDSETYRFRDREDTSFSFELAYPVLPKTRLFIEYNRFDINYRLSDQPGSDEEQYNIGLEWYISSKSRGIVKTGYGVRSFEDPGSRSVNNYILEGQIGYTISSDTALDITARRRYQETNIPDTDYIDTTELTANCHYNLTARIYLDTELGFEMDDFYGNNARTGDEKTYTVSPSLNYLFKKWLVFTLEYTFEERSLNLSKDSLSTETNTILFNINAGI
ncbi:MAG: outer membrane beta-barrel protein [Proteobacteria bacterium]|nr:outer membrane beta-barrel protein [Pseudomonadota bacterium]